MAAVDAKPRSREARKQLGLVRQWIVEGAKQGMGNADANLVWSPLPDGFHPVHGIDQSHRSK